MRTNWINLALGSLVAWALSAERIAAQQRPADAAVILQAAAHQETVIGNLDSAIVLYRRAADDRRAPRAVTARALVGLGRSYEALGSSEARKAYERVIRDFADQSSEAGAARLRLASMGQSGRNQRATTDGPVAKRLWSGPQVDLMGAVSPDGRKLTFVDWSTSELAVRDLIAGSNRNITNSGSWAVNNDYAESSVWSPDGSQVAFTWSTGAEYELRVAPADGGTSRTLFKRPDVGYFRVDDWSPDGKSVLALFYRVDQSTEMALVSVADGTARTLKKFDWRAPFEMGFSPDGRWIAYDFSSVEGDPARDIYVRAVDGTSETAVVRHPADERLLGWTRDGAGILFTTTRRGVRDVALLPMRGGEAAGEVRAVKADAGSVLPLGFTASGDFYYGARHGGSDVLVGAIDFSTGRLAGDLARLPVSVEGGNHHPAWSPDGKLIAWVADPTGPGAGAARVITIRDLDAESERRIPVFNFSRILELKWSPDQRAIFALGNNRKEGNGIYRIDLASGVQTRLDLATGKGIIARRPDSRMMDITPDGRTLIYSTVANRQGVARLMAHDLVTGASRELHTMASSPDMMKFYGILLSPSGRELAFSAIDNSPVTGATIFVMPLEGGSPREVVRHSAYIEPAAWLDDGNSILYEADSVASPPIHHSHQLWRVSKDGGKAVRLGVSAELLINIRLHPDGRRFTFSRGQPQQEVWLLENALPRQRPARAARP